MNPFDLPGPAFLALYVATLVGALIVALALRWFLRLPAGEPPTEAFDLSPYELAYLSGRARLVIDTVIVRLIRRGALTLDQAKGRVAWRGAEQPHSDDALESAVLAAAEARGSHINDIQQRVANAVSTLRPRLDALGLLVSPAQSALMQWVSGSVVMLAGIFGVIKVGVGLERQRPVGFLLALLVVTAIIAIVFIAKRPFRSRSGDELLSRLKADHAALEYAIQRRGTELADADLVLALGLFGLGALAGTALASTYTALRSAQLRAASGSSLASSCGGSGCGGGGCGGGGCGGGCGGCGG